MAEVQLHGVNACGRVALVDDADLELVSGYRWSVQEYQTARGYVQGPYARSWGSRDGRKTMIFMHQLIAGVWADHADGNGLDNRRTNLRPATPRLNAANKGKRPGTSSQFIGVSWWTAGGRWKAAIREGGKARHLGLFDDEVEAAMVRDHAAIKVFGEFARLNFPERMTTEDMEDDQDRGSETFCSVCGPLDEPGAHNQPDCPRGNTPHRPQEHLMSTISQWLDSYDGEDNLVAGVARIWRAAKDENDARPRVSAPQSVSTWLAEHRGVADESLRAVVRAYNESRGGRQLTLGEEGAFRAMNEPGTIAAVPGDHEQPGPAVMAALGRIESQLSVQGIQHESILKQLLDVAKAVQWLQGWTQAQDERIKPITDLLGELAEAEQAPDQGEPDGEAQHAAGAVTEADLQPQPTGSLWRNIAAPEPDPERMAALGDPRLVEDEGS